MPRVRGKPCRSIKHSASKTRWRAEFSAQWRCANARGPASLDTGPAIEETIETAQRPRRGERSSDRLRPLRRRQDCGKVPGQLDAGKLGDKSKVAGEGGGAAVFW